VHRIVCNVSYCTSLLNNGVGSIGIVRCWKRVSECVCILWVRTMVPEKNGHNNSSHTYTSAHKKPNICMLAVFELTWEKPLFWQFTCPLRWNQALPLNRMGVVSISLPCITWTRTCSQNSVLLLGLHCRDVNHGHVVWMKMQQYFLQSVLMSSYENFLCKSSQLSSQGCLQSSTHSP